MTTTTLVKTANSETIVKEFIAVRLTHSDESVSHDIWDADLIPYLNKPSENGVKPAVHVTVLGKPFTISHQIV